MNKDYKAIDKIIAELAMKDYRAANPTNADGKPKYKKYHPYTLGIETNYYREIKIAYSKNEITEEQYKAECLRYNLTHK